MLKFEEAKNKILSLAENTNFEEIELSESFNRVLAQDIFATRDFPDRKKSAVDGFAVNGKLKHFKLAGVYSITEEVKNLSDSEAVFVMTGGVVPDNADAVLRVEDCEVSDGVIGYEKAIKTGENISKIGEEILSGKLIAEKGSVINERLFPVLVYAGVKKVRVYRLPKIAFFTTGDEILNLEDEYNPGYIFNTNRYIFEKAALKLGLDLFFYKNVKDDETGVGDAIKMLSNDYDIIVTSGGISMGKYDFVKKVLSEQNYEIIVNKTSIKPGSPLMVAKGEKSFIFGLPGYPAAFLTNMFLYLIPFLKKFMGRKDYDNRFIKGVLKTEMHSGINADCFNRAVVKHEDGRFCVYDAGSQKTSHFLNFAGCDGLFRIPEGIGDISEGFVGDLILFDLELS